MGAPPPARLEGELRQGLHRRQPRRAHGGVEAAVVAQRDLRRQQFLDGLGRGRGTAVGARQDAVRGLQGAGHLQVGEHRPHPVAPAARRGPHPAAWA